MAEYSYAIFGLARSNLAVIRRLVAEGVSLVAWDDNAGAREKAVALGAEVREFSPQDYDVLVLAPGVPHENAVVREAKDAGKEIICDIELRYRMGWQCSTVGITGTNGKSTTTALIGHILEQAGVPHAVGGNIGKPIFDLDIPDDGVLVLELSSFQLELCPTFRPDISVLMNITPDHLDRHGSMEAYVAAKARMFEGEGSAYFAGDDTYSRAIQNDSERNLISCAVNFEETQYLKGAHNIQNMKAAFAVCKALGLDEVEILKHIQSFEGLPHRQKLVRTIGKISFVNDSKATNAESAAKALGAFENIFWIVGGVAKEGGLEGLEIYKDRIRQAFVIGETPQDFVPFLQQYNVLHNAIEGLEEAVRVAYEEACKYAEAWVAAQGEEQGGAAASGGGCVILLSPAAASYDQYNNFEERGADFEQAVRGL